jgi:hypothetical protein
VRACELWYAFDFALSLYFSFIHSHLFIVHLCLPLLHYLMQYECIYTHLYLFIYFSYDYFGSIFSKT